MKTKKDKRKIRKKKRAKNCEKQRWKLQFEKCEIWWVGLGLIYIEI